MKKIRLLVMAGGIVYVWYQFFHDSIYDAMNNIVIILLLYNSFLILDENRIFKRNSKADIAFSVVIIIMASIGSYWWLRVKGFL